MPHWEAEGATYFVTFRLFDSLPRSVLDSFRFERKDIVLTAEQRGRALTPAEQKRLHILFSERVEAYLDSGCGAQSEVAEMVAGALQFFDGLRYRQFAWSVMPNHVHAVFKSLPSWPFAKIMHSWKSFTAKEANKILAGGGVLGAGVLRPPHSG